jgi:hypothetical protein
VKYSAAAIYLPPIQFITRIEVATETGRRKEERLNLIMAMALWSLPFPCLRVCGASVAKLDEKRKAEKFH